MQCLLDHRHRNAQIVRVQIATRAISCHRHRQIIALAQQQKSAFARRNRKRCVHHRGQHFLGRQRILKRARDLHQRPQFRQIIRARPGPAAMRRGPELIHNPVNLAVLNRKRELVRFAHAQLDAIGIA